MKAIVYREYGSAEVLRLEEVPKPIPKTGEVLIRVCAAAFNPLDWHMMRGLPGFIRLFIGLRKPTKTRLGVDVAGEVEEVGSSVTGFKPGDAVFGVLDGAFAEYACGPASALAIKPDNVTYAQAAAMPIGGLTALQALRDKGRLQPGQKVLINGASGGVGTFAVQIARWMGARVSGVCSRHNEQMVLGLGAERVIDYTHEDFAAGPERYDVIFDLVGNRTLSDFRRVLNSTGTYIGCGGGGPETSSMHLLAGMLQPRVAGCFTRQRLVGVLAQRKKEDLDLLNRLLESGDIMPAIDRSFSLESVPDAIRYLEKGHARGKVVLSLHR